MTVSAHGSCLVDPGTGAAGDTDTAVVVLEYADGRLATIRGARLAATTSGWRFWDRKVRFRRKTCANMRWRNPSPPECCLRQPVHFFLERYMRAYAMEWTAFVDACVDGRSVPATIADGVNSLALAEAVNRSLAEGRPVEVTAEMTGP